MPSRKTTLFVPSPSTAIASGSGTPASIIVASSRQKRSTIEYRRSSPITGTLSTNLSRSRRPPAVRPRSQSPNATRTDPIRIAHQKWRRKSVNPISMRVGSGRVACSDSKNTLNRGSTNTASTITVAIEAEQDDRRVGQRRLHLASRFEVALDVPRQLVQHVVEPAGQLRGSDHVDVELWEERFEGRERGRERVAGDQRFLDSCQDLAERLVLGLFLDDLRAPPRAGYRLARTPRAAARSASVPPASASSE